MKSKGQPNWPHVSIVIPTRNRSDELRECLISLVQQDYCDATCEIVVVNNNSADCTSSVIKEVAGTHGGLQIREVFEISPGVNKARNRGIAASSGSIIWLLDDDVLPPPGALRCLVTTLELNKWLSGVGGGSRSLADASITTACSNCKRTLKAALYPMPKGVTEVEELLGGNALIPRETFDKFGLFDERLSGAGDDFEWFRRTRRQGARFAVAEDGWVWHTVSGREMTSSALITKNIAWGTNLASTNRILDSEISLGSLALKAGRLILHSIRARCVLALAQAVGTLTFLLATLWLRVAEALKRPSG